MNAWLPGGELLSSAGAGAPGCGGGVVRGGGPDTSRTDQPQRPGRERERGSPSGPSREARRGDRQVLPPLHRPRVRDTPGGTNINCEKLMAIIKRQGEMGMGLFCGS